MKALNGKDGRQIFNVDIGSVYKTESGHPVYWLEKADVMQRNKWELIISMELSSGLTGNVTSRPFRVTTKASDKMRRKGGMYLTGLGCIEWDLSKNVEIKYCPS